MHPFPRSEDRACGPEDECCVNERMPVPEDDNGDTVEDDDDDEEAPGIHEDSENDLRMGHLLDWVLFQSSEFLGSLKTHTLLVYPGSIILSSNNLEEVNKLRETYANQCYLIISKP